MTEMQDRQGPQLNDLARSEAGVLEFLLTAPLDGVWYRDLSAPDNEWLSGHLASALGYHRHEIDDVGKWWRNRVVQEDLRWAIDALTTRMQIEQVSQEQLIRCHHKNGGLVRFRCRWLTINDKSGRACGLLGALTDVTHVETGQIEDRDADYGRDASTLTDFLPQLVWTCDSRGVCDYSNRPWLEYTGLSWEQGLLHRWMDRVHPDDLRMCRSKWSEAIATGSEFCMELRLRRFDASYRWFDSRAVPMPDDSNGKWIGSHTDVTERRLVSDAARKGQAAIETVITHMSEGLVICEVEGRLLHWNPAGLAMHGFSSMDEGLRKLPELAGVFELTTLDGETIDYEDWPLSRICRGEPVQGVELRLRRLDLEWERMFSCSGSIVQLPDSTQLAFLTITDLTERDRAVRALADSEQRLRVANEVAGIGTYELDYTTQQLRLSPELCAIGGLPADSSLDLEQLISRIHPVDRARLERTSPNDSDPGPPKEMRIIRADGELRWLSWSSRVLVEHGPGGSKRTKAVGACFDVTEQRLSQRRLMTHNAVNRVLADATELNEASPQIMRAICEAEDLDFGAIWQVDEAAGVLRCADVWHRQELSLDDLAAKTRTLEFPLGVGLPGRVWKQGTPLIIEDVHKDPNYSRALYAEPHHLRTALAFPIVARGKVTGVVDFLGRSVHGPTDKLLETVAPLGHQLGAFFDRKRTEAERRELEKQLQQAQKMDALGQLSGGIAHDFNNVLTAILSNAEIALLDLPADSGVHENLRAIEEASHRAKNLVWQILAFARQQPQARRTIPLAPHIDESVRLLRATIPAGVELVVTSDADVPDVLADGTQMQQVFLNLVTNAWHALEGTGGRVLLSLSNVWVDAVTARSIPGLRIGHFARVTIEDTGQGMPASVLDRVFEPFFTTKEPGRGTGLGLSVVHGIVRNHEGAIHIRSSVGEGTQVDVYFPAAAQRPPSVPTEQVSRGDGTGQRIIYVDDEQALVTVAERTLSRLGYQVLGFSSPEKALQAFRDDPAGFALVATDLNMPLLSGIQLTVQLRAIRHDIPILLLSGHISDDLRVAATNAGIRNFLYKPYRLTELGDAVRAAMASSPVLEST